MEPLEFVEKHVVISMSNGAVLEGFVTHMKDDFLTLIEFDNAKVLVRIEHISFIRLKSTESIPKEEPTERLFRAKPIAVKRSQSEFSMPLNPEVGNDSYVRQTEFIRETPRKNT